MAHYILFDSSQHMRFNEQLERWNIPYRSLFRGHPESVFPDMAPLLFDRADAGYPDGEAVHEVGRIARLKPCVSVLVSDMSLPVLAEHLGAFHLVEIPDRRRMIMRWYDTRILPVWLDTLKPEQRALFMRGITQWNSFDRFGDEQWLGGAQPAAVASNAEPVPLPLQLDQQQIDRLFEAAEPDALMADLRSGDLRAELAQVPPRTLYPFVREYWERARQYSITKPADQLLFLTLALLTSGAFLQHSAFTEFMVRLPDHTTLADRITDLPDSISTAGRPFWEQAST